MKQDTVTKLNKVLDISGELVKRDLSPKVDINTIDLSNEYEVVTQLLSGLTNTTKELLVLQKTKKEIEKETKDPSTVNNSLFIGSTAELQELLTAKKK